MDKTYRGFSGDPVVITGIGIAVSENLREYFLGVRDFVLSDMISYECEPFDYLRQRKTLKFMSKQDRLALEAAGKALDIAAIPQEVLSNHTGVFITVGYIPFEFDTAAELCKGSMENGRFSMQQFSTTGIDDINPLLAFACLPNMPAHHVAMNFEIFGQYFITYPDNIQFYHALQESVLRLVQGEIDCALVGGVADQNNFLVRHHFNKVRPDSDCFAADCGAFMVLETKSAAQKRRADIVMELEFLDLQWDEQSNPQKNNPTDRICLGPAELPFHLALFTENDSPEYRHLIQCNEIIAQSRWKKP
ncbi:MAG: hypothetical protein KKE17_00735 [Proteobacteria bacterium]|nr:hypothetical protein [Pseudomonadota bacterium]MBU1708506.1 hypothetical protein [Pseudomonadota bacterium]